RRVVANSDRLARGGDRASDPLLLTFEVIIVLGTNAGQRRMCESKTRIESHCILVHLQSELQILTTDSAGIIPPAEIQSVIRKILGRFYGKGFLFLRRECDTQRRRDL